MYYSLIGRHPSLFLLVYQKLEEKNTFSHFFSGWKKVEGKKSIFSFFFLYGKTIEGKKHITTHSNGTIRTHIAPKSSLTFFNFFVFFVCFFSFFFFF
jgi:hypothetical protein